MSIRRPKRPCRRRPHERPVRLAACEAALPAAAGPADVGRDRGRAAVAAWLLPGISVDGFRGALVTALLIAILNAALPPIAAALRIPFMAVLGFLIALFLNAVMLLLASRIDAAAITVDNFGWALLAALVASAIGRCSVRAAGDERRRHVHAADDPAHRQAAGRRRRHRRAGPALPGDRRPRPAGAPAGDARRLGADAGPLGRRGNPPAGRMGARPLLPDRGEPGWDPAGLEPGHPRVSLGGEGDRAGGGLLGARRTARRSSRSTRPASACSSTAARAAGTCCPERPTR